MSPVLQNKPDLEIPQFLTLNTLSIYENQKFTEHCFTRLNIYKNDFQRYSDQHEIPWTLLAAVAYQESKWDEDAISPTGVKGLMQLTSKTAEHLGIVNREDPLQSIQGGAFYLKYLYEKTPQKLKAAQRWVLALSAYNIGWGHLQDARQLALLLKRNPNNWADLKTVLPKLENKFYHEQLPLGFARGNETVAFVDKVITYYNMLNSTYNITSMQP